MSRASTFFFRVWPCHVTTALALRSCDHFVTARPSRWRWCSFWFLHAIQAWKLSPMIRCRLACSSPAYADQARSNLSAVRASRFDSCRRSWKLRIPCSRARVLQFRTAARHFFRRTAEHMAWAASTLVFRNCMTWIQPANAPDSTMVSMSRMMFMSSPPWAFWTIFRCFLTQW